MSRTARPRGAHVLILSALALLTMTNAPAALGDSKHCSQQSGRKVEYRFGGLAEGVLTIEVPAANVRHLVPESYTLVGRAPGTATIVAAFGSVDSLTVGCDDEPRSSVVSEYGVFINSPDKKELNLRHAYYLWQLSDNGKLVDAMRKLGVPSHYAESGFTVVQQAGIVTVAAYTSWAGSPNQFEARATEPSTVRGADAPGVRFWYDGPRGTVRVAYECPTCLPRTTAVGSVEATKADSRLNAVLGGVKRAGVGFFIRTDLVATAELRPRV